jgi:hypothetical protein
VISSKAVWGQLPQFSTSRSELAAIVRLDYFLFADPPGTIDKNCGAVYGCRKELLEGRRSADHCLPMNGSHASRASFESCDARELRRIGRVIISSNMRTVGFLLLPIMFLLADRGSAVIPISAGPSSSLPTTSISRGEHSISNPNAAGIPFRLPRPSRLPGCLANCSERPTTSSSAVGDTARRFRSRFHLAAKSGERYSSTARVT